ncbi:hypothetical protein AB0E69_11435 [Kribbella sp. NPDC026611]|uniref:hypothetical protein n=1 Tax=Kribbella sp. NPDC026611 TaxID=3154911 RepID=UPI0033CE8487
MSTDDHIFVAGSASLEEAAQWLSGVLRLEPVDDPDLKDGVRLFRGDARTADGPLYVLVEPNVYGETDPAPEDVSAVDGYPIAVEVRLLGARHEDAQASEARAVFDELVQTQPPAALILSHALSWIVAAYLPGTGTHTFPPHTSLDADHLDTWRPWIAS